MPPGAEVNDDDRAMVAQLLQRHAVDGRLTLGELAERVNTAYQTDAWPALQALLADLPVVPVSPPLPAVAPPPARLTTRKKGDLARAAFFVHVGIYLSVIAFLIAVWALTGAGYFWPIWPALGWGVGIAAHGFATSGVSRLHSG
jgi:hypothetical protein